MWRPHHTWTLRVLALVAAFVLGSPRPPSVHFTLLVGFVAVYAWVLYTARHRWSWITLGLFAVAGAALPYAPSSWRLWLSLVVALSALAPEALDELRGAREFPPQAREALRADLEQRFNVPDYVGIYAPLRVKFWAERLAGTPPGDELKPLAEQDRRGDLEKRICDVARRHPTLWAILAHETRQERQIMERSLISNQCIADRSLKSAEWHAIEERLKELLEKHGCGRDDFHLVDDEYGEAAHKLELQTIEFLTPEFVRDIQNALRGWRHDWAVMIQLSFDEPPLSWHLFSIDVHADRVLENWDRDLLKRHLGERFKV